MFGTFSAWPIPGGAAVFAWLGALAGCLVLIGGLMPLFGRVALAVPTHRSSHKTPTPQWGGLAISIATLGAAVIAASVAGIGGGETHSLVLVSLSAAVLVVLGGFDDMRPLGPGLKFAVQAAAIVVMLAALPDDLRILPIVPEWLERGALLLGALWFVNLVNFMDGIDWMMVVEVVPITAGIAIIGSIVPLPPEALLVALALNGAMLGFAPFNRPVARLFMGDTGSLSIGVLLAWLLIVLAGGGHLVAALLLPLYFIADTGVTLLRRAVAGERVWEAHRTHFYQRARDNGFDNWQIVGRVAAVNCGLVALAVITVLAPSRTLHVLTLIVGAGLVSWVMIAFSRPRA
jgi:UDP-N-acetylmuramyl pentapeptide phosphotransferase/UDP-N-acetylglucosamine-1-phosphate transferase